jgi:hypothetical protein
MEFSVEGEGHRVFEKIRGGRDTRWNRLRTSDVDNVHMWDFWDAPCYVQV